MRPGSSPAVGRRGSAPWPPCSSSCSTSTRRSSTSPWCSSASSSPAAWCWAGECGGAARAGCGSSVWGQHRPCGRALAAGVWRCNEVARRRKGVMGAGTPWGMSSGGVGWPWGGTTQGLAVGMGVWGLAVVGEAGLC